MIERLSTLLGVDPRELSGTTVDAELPLTAAVINRKIAGNVFEQADLQRRLGRLGGTQRRHSERDAK